MSEHLSNATHETEPTLVEQVMAQSKHDVEALRKLSQEALRPSRAETERQTIVLSDAIGEFVISHLDDDIEAMSSLPFTDTVEQAINAYATAFARENLLQTIRTESKKRQVARMESLLEGKVIKATSLDIYGHPIANGHSLVSGPGMPKVVVGQFVGYQPEFPRIVLGTSWERGTYVRLWGYEGTPYGVIYDEIVPGSSLEIIEN